MHPRIPCSRPFEAQSGQENREVQGRKRFQILAIQRPWNPLRLPSVLNPVRALYQLINASAAKRNCPLKRLGKRFRGSVNINQNRPLSEGQRGSGNKRRRFAEQPRILGREKQSVNGTGCQ